MNNKKSVSVKINSLDLTYMRPDVYNTITSKYIDVTISTNTNKIYEVTSANVYYSLRL